MKTNTESHDEQVFHICLVEDNPGDVYLLEKSLKRFQIDYRLTWYRDGERAIDAITQTGHAVPDLFLIDLKTPRRDGFEVLQTIKSQPRLASVRIGVLTSSDAPSDRYRVAQQSVDRYINKPTNLEDFLNQVGRAVRDLL